MADPKIRVDLTVDDRATGKIDQALSRVQNAAKNTAQNIAGSFGAAGEFISSIASGPTAVAASLITLSVVATRMASDVETAGRRINSVFPGVVEAAKPLSNEFGVAQTAVLKLFDTIEKNGEGSRQGLENTARAALQLNQALAGTPEELTGIADALDQTLDLFQLNGTEAGTVAAQLFNISKGRVPLQELTDAFRASAVTIRDNKIPLDLAAAGLTKLLEAGLPARKAASELQQEIAKGSDSFREFVGPVTNATEATNAFQERVRLLGETSAVQSARVRTELGNTLIDLGNKILPTVNNALRNTNTLLDQLSGRSGAFDDLDTIGDLATQRNTPGEHLNARERNIASRRVGDLDEQLRDGDISFGEMSSGQLKDLQRNLESLSGVMNDPTFEAARVRMIGQLQVLNNPPAPTTPVVIRPTEAETEAAVKAADRHRQALLALANAGHLPIAGLNELLTADASLTRQLNNANITIERRAELVKELTAVQSALAKTLPEVTARVVERRDPTQLELRDTSNLSILPTPELATSTSLQTDYIAEGFINGTTALQEFSDKLQQAGSFSNDLKMSLGEMAGQTLVNLQGAFATSFEAIAQGANVFKSLADAAKKSIAQAAAFAGREQFAKAAAKLAEGLFGGGPAAFASAGKHVLAGGLFMGLAGAAGGSGGSGGGGTSSYTRQRDLGTNGDTTMKKGEATIVINGGILDMSDPRQAQALADALGKLTDRRVITVGA